MLACQRYNERPYKNNKMSSDMRSVAILKPPNFYKSAENVIIANNDYLAISSAGTQAPGM